MLDPSFQDFIINRFHSGSSMNNTENGKGVLARLNGLTQYFSACQEKYLRELSVTGTSR
jgi:hypothetical protein